MVEIAIPETVSSLKERIRSRVSSCIDFDRDVPDEEIVSLIDLCILEETRNMYIPLKEKVQLRKEIFNTFRRLDVLTELLEDESITEIMVNGLEEIYVERDGKLQLSGKRFSSEKKLMSVVQRLAGDCNRRINEASPVVDVRLKDGSRGNIVIAPVSLSGTIITIRRFPKEKMTMNKLIELGCLDQEVADFLGVLVRSRYNLLVSGGTGTGKTTFLNVLANYIDQDERIVTIEDSAELQLGGVRNLVRMESRQANMEGENEVTIRQLIRTSLRMRPDRIIVGEVRGEEAVDMLQAMNTGHDGSLSTGHANSPEDMLARLETMVLQGMEMPLLAIKKQIESAIDIVIQLGRMRDGSRRVKKICEVKGMRDGEIEMNTLFEFVETGVQKGKILGGLQKVNQLIHIDKLMDSGNYVDYKKMMLEVEAV